MESAEGEKQLQKIIGKYEARLAELMMELDTIKENHKNERKKIEMALLKAQNENSKNLELRQ